MPEYPVVYKRGLIEFDVVSLYEYDALRAYADQEHERAERAIVERGDLVLRAALAENRAERVERQLALSVRDGNFLDKLGCCKVCDGEIPDGHQDHCDIWKIEKRHLDFISNEYNKCLQERDKAVNELAEARAQEKTVRGDFTRILWALNRAESALRDLLTLNEGGEAWRSRHADAIADATRRKDTP